MELTKEFIKENKLEDSVVKSIDDLHKDDIATVKKEFDGKANKNAEAILTGAMQGIKDFTKIDRNQGEKVKDYIPRAWDEFNKEKLLEVENAKLSYEDKIKNFKGNEDLIMQNTSLGVKNDDLLKKYADYDSLKEKSELYDPLLIKYDLNKKEVGYNSVKPNFPKEVNEWEAKAKWDEFRNKTDKTHKIEFIDSVAIAIDRENKHKQINLSDLVGKDETLKSLLKGRQQRGIGSTDATMTDIKDVPFQIPEGLDSEGRSELIRDYLSKKGIANTNPKYSDEFEKLNTAILQA